MGGGAGEGRTESQAARNASEPNEWSEWNEWTEWYGTAGAGCGEGERAVRREAR